jgi:hypothetical protein
MAGRRPSTDPDERNKRIRFLGVVVSLHAEMSNASWKYVIAVMQEFKRQRVPLCPNEANLQRTQAYHNRIRTALSSMPAMTSEEFYQQMEKSMGKKTTWIAPSNSGLSKPRRVG